MSEANGGERPKNALAEMGEYSQFIISGMDVERKHISQELHDTVLQEIKALSIQVELLPAGYATCRWDARWR